MRIFVELARKMGRDLPHFGLSGVNYGRHARAAF